MNNNRPRPQMRAGEDSVVSGSYDATIRLWCLKTGVCRKVERCYDSTFYWIRILIRNCQKAENPTPDPDPRPES